MSDISATQSASGLIREPGPQAAGGWTVLRRSVAMPDAAHAVALAAAVFVAAVASILATRGAGSIATLWPVHGLALAGLLLGPRTRGFQALGVALILAALLAANLAVGNSAERMAVFMTANAVELAAALLLVRRIDAKGPDLGTLAGLTRFLLIVPLGAPLLGAAFGAGAFALIEQADFAATFATWYMSHALGMAVVAPFALTLTCRSLRPLKSGPYAAQAAAALALLVVVCLFAFASGARMGYLVSPVLLLATVRFRLLGATTGVFVVALISIGALLNGFGPAGPGGVSQEEAIRTLQLYLILGCLPMLPVATVLNERDRMAREAARGRERAETASAGKSKLLANVSHEVRTPLNAIMGFGDLLLRERMGPLNDRQKDLLRTIVGSAEQLNALAQDLIDVAKAEAGKLSVEKVRLDVRSVAREVGDRLQLKAAEMDTALRLELTDRPLEALADPMRLAQILNNLVTNALKYAGAHGPVVLRADRMDDGWVRLEVADSGPGIPLDRQAELFEPFNRLGKEAGRIDGTGIGLAISRKLAELQGGRLDFESAPGEGSRFWVDLPAAR